MKRVNSNNFSQFSNSKCEEYITRYSNPWCSCERNTSKDCFKDETSDICKMKIREFKMLAPKKCSFNQEFENMDLEYDGRSQKLEKEGRYECCRIRANLCELPTTYVANNHQLSNNLIDNARMSKETSDYVELKSVTYEHSLKFVDFNDQLENLGSMLDKSKNEPLNKISPIKKDYYRTDKKIEGRSPLKNGNSYISKNSSKVYQDKVICNQNNVFKESCGGFRNTNLNTVKNNCREYCPLVDFKYHNLSDHKYVCYDTSTYFDKRNELPNVCYSSEVEYLRDKLKTMQNNTYSSYVNCNRNQDLIKDIISSTIQGDKNSSGIKDIHVSPMNIKPKLRKERRILSPTLIKGRHRLSLKTKTRVNSCKLKKIRSKQSLNVSTGSQCLER